ncbi:MAG TPA: polysaccharide deacetylase family protein [Allosphingosinicella sp.]|nr:polysaccharide deacetylase family protein [Allosphingosinicella sp.]
MGLLVLLLLGYSLLRLADARCFALTGEAICHVETDAPVVALSLDDGPTPQGVATATAALRRAGAHATFFLIGSAVEQHPELVRQILADGNEVGNHSYSHVRMIGRPSAFYDAEIGRTDTALRRAGVAAPNLFRPPYAKKLIGLPRAVARHGYKMILWDVEDPRGARDPADYAARIVRQARPGSIVLMHLMYSHNGNARAALPLVLRGLQARGFKVVTVGELLKLRRR